MLGGEKVTVARAFDVDDAVVVAVLELRRGVPDLAHPEPPPRLFQLTVDGRAVGFTHGHGASLRWLDLNLA